MFCHRMPAPKVPGVPTKTRLESSIKKFKPYFIYVCFFQAPKTAPPGLFEACQKCFEATASDRPSFKDLHTSLEKLVVDTAPARPASVLTKKVRAPFLGAIFLSFLEEALVCCRVLELLEKPTFSI